MVVGTGPWDPFESETERFGLETVLPQRGLVYGAISIGCWNARSNMLLAFQHSFRCSTARRDDDAHNMCASSSRRVLHQIGDPILSRYREVHRGISRVRS